MVTYRGGRGVQDINLQLWRWRQQVLATDQCRNVPKRQTYSEGIKLREVLVTCD